MKRAAVARASNYSGLVDTVPFTISLKDIGDTSDNFNTVTGVKTSSTNPKTGDSVAEGAMGFPGCFIHRRFGTPDVVEIIKEKF